MTDEEYLEYKRQSMGGLFAEEASGLRASLSDEAREKLFSAADKKLEGYYVLPGTGGKYMYLGAPPKWLERTVPDVEFHWQLNRLSELGTLTRAYLVSGNEAYARQAITNLLDWIKTCPVPEFEDASITAAEANKHFNSLTPWRALEAGIRMFGAYPSFYRNMLLSELMTPELHSAILLSVYEHGRVLAYASPLIWPNADHNHYVHEMLGLLKL